MNKKITLQELIKEIGRLPSEARQTVLEGAAAGLFNALDEHFIERQSEPRKDGFPSSGFWVNNNGTSVREAMQEPVYSGDSALIRIEHAPLKHKLNLSPPPIKPGAGKKYLTLPAKPQAATMPARDFPDLKFAMVGIDGHKATSDETNILPALIDSSDTAMFWLARKVQTPHDPNALPSEDDLADAAREAAKEVVKMLMA